MSRAHALLACLAAVLAAPLARAQSGQDAPAPPPAQPAPASPSPRLLAGELRNDDRALTWDVNLEAGYGRIFLDPSVALWQYRVRGGLLLVNDSTYFFAGATWEPNNRSAKIFGAQVEVLQIQAGFWTQLGANFDLDGAHPGFVAAMGLSLVGLEAQYRAHEGAGSAWSLAAKLRLPLGVIGHAWSTR